MGEIGYILLGVGATVIVFILISVVKLLNNDATFSLTLKVLPLGGENSYRFELKAINNTNDDRLFVDLGLFYVLNDHLYFLAEMSSAPLSKDASSYLTETIEKKKQYFISFPNKKESSAVIILKKSGSKKIPTGATFYLSYQNPNKKRKFAEIDLKKNEPQKLVFKKKKFSND